MFSPFGDTENNANVKAAWHPEPQFRGTHGILSSCLITLGLCIWTAVHLNIPEHSKAKSQVWRKLKWLLIALLAPEIIVWTAFEQRREAKLLQSRVCKALSQPLAKTKWQKMRSILDFVLRRGPNSSDFDNESGVSANDRPTRLHTWTLVHSHFAAMGGFCFDTTNAEVNFLPGKRTRVTLTSLGVCYLAELAPELLPDLPKEHIRDKSKADGFGKTLACLQAFWFCTQCISRLATGLSITLLELNTFAHALCALLAYAFWWNKPHDVNEPVLIQGPQMHMICAAMCMRSCMGAEHASGGYFEGDHHVGRIWEQSLGFSCPRDFGLQELLVAHRATRERAAESPPIYSEASLERPIAPLGQGEKTDPKEALDFRLYMGQSLYGFGFRRRRTYYSSLKTKIGDIGILHLRRPFIDLTPSNVRLWQLASEGLGNYPDLLYLRPGEDYRSYADKNSQKMHRRFLTEFCTNRISNYPQMSLDSEQDTWSLLYTFLVAGLSYGLLHLSAWRAPFHSKVEAVLWRISAITLCISGFVPILAIGTLGIGVALMETKIGTNFRKFVNELKSGHPAMFDGIMASRALIGFLAFYIVTSGFVLLYLFSRVYLIVECFLKLPYLPQTALDMPRWSQYFSHIT